MNSYIDIKKFTSRSNRVIKSINLSKGTKVLISIKDFDFFNVLLFVHFVEDICKYTTKRIFIGLSPELEILKILLPSIPFYILRRDNLDIYFSKFDTVVDLGNSITNDISDNISNTFGKNILGLKEHILTPMRFNVSVDNKYSDKVGVSFLNKYKIPSYHIIDDIIDELSDSGLYIDQFYFNVNSFKHDCIENKVTKIEPFTVDVKNPINFGIDNLMRVIREISSCKLIISTESEFLLLSYLIIGHDGCIILNENKFITKSFHFFNNFIDISNGYDKGSIYSLINEIYRKNFKN